MFYKVFYNHICIDYKSKSSRSQVFFKLILKKISLKNSVEEKSSFAKSLKIYSYFSAN